MYNDWLQNFEPSTATEVALLSEIKKLKIELMLTQRDKGINPHFIDDKELVMTTKEEVPILKLEWAARLKANIDHRGSLCVRTEWKGSDNQWGSQYFVNEKLNALQAADLAIVLHKKELQNIARAMLK